MRTFMLHYNFPPFSVGEARLPALRDDVKSGTGRLPSAR